MTVALGADWLPSGSPTLLDEAQVARRMLHEQGADLPAQRLVQMFTADAVTVAGYPDSLGRLEANRSAELVVLQRYGEDPWESVLSPTAAASRSS